MIGKNKYFNKAELFNLKLNLLCLILIIIIFVIDLNIPLGVAGGVPYIVVILVSLWSSKFHIVIYLAVICSLMTLLGFYFSPTGSELWKVIFNRGLALFAIWITAILALNWKRHEKEIRSLNRKVEKEKEKIYLATIHGAQHITNNLLNQLQIVELEIESHQEFDQEVSLMFKDMLIEASSLMKALSGAEKIDAKTIRKSICPK